MKKLFFLWIINILFSISLPAQSGSFWGLKGIYQVTKEGFKKIYASPTSGGGHTTPFAVNYSYGNCTENYTLNWSFSKDVTRLEGGDVVKVTLQGTASNDCINRAPFLSLGFSGSSISVNVSEGRIDDARVTRGFEGYIEGCQDF